MAPTKDENGDDSKQNAPEYRDRLRTWLIKMIDSGTIPGLQWENEEKTIFRMPWKHAGRQDYSLEEDSRIFMAWAIHSGRYREGIDKPEPIIWKTRLRCALNKMPDIREIPERSRLDISEPYRVYHLLPPVHKDTQIRRRLQRRHSAAQSSDAARLLPPLNSPSFPRKESGPSNSPPSIKFGEPRLPTRPIDLQGGVNRRNLTPPAHLDLGVLGRPNPWLGATSLLPGADNRLLQGLNCLSPTTNFHNFMNPTNLFSSAMLQRDIRHRPEFDFLPMPYQPSLLEQQAMHPFLMPRNPTIGGLPLNSKVRVPPPAFSHRFDAIKGAEESQSDARNVVKVRKDEKEEAKYRIELLELEITKWKNAYENERISREEVERKYEYLKKALENVGGDMIAMLRRGAPEIENAVDNEREFSQDPTRLHTSRRRSADDSQERQQSFIKRPERHSTEEIPSTHNISESGRKSSESAKRRRMNDDCSSALDLSNTSPQKKQRMRSPRDESLCTYRRHVEKETHESTNGHFLSGSQTIENNFHLASPRVSYDDETDVSIPNNATHKSVKSPSASSSCSSAEESYIAASLSPTIPRSSPVIPIFRARESTKYPSYSQRVEGAIKVT